MATKSTSDGADPQCRKESRSPRRHFGNRHQLATTSSKPRWPGCHVAHRSAPWILGLQSLHEAGLESPLDVPLPDISIDPDEKILSVINTTENDRCYYVSLPGECGCTSITGRRLATGQSKDSAGTFRNVITFILVVGPRQVMDVCELEGTIDIFSVEVQSDIMVLHPTPPMPADSDFFCRAYGFPLDDTRGPFFCSQSSGGRLTHFAHPSTFHAVDLDCPVGTTVLAVGDGTIKEVKDSDDVSGIDIRNFYCWNQVTVLQSDGAIVEYVHVQKGSSRVKVGDVVQRGQPLCFSGDVGFCPTPHLHIEVHLEDGRSVPSVPFSFIGSTGPFRCRDGQLYDSSGMCSSTANPVSRQRGVTIAT